MDPTTLKTLAAELLIAVATLMGNTTVEAPPNVLPVTQRELAVTLCNKPCPAHAYFQPGKGIWIADHMDLNDLNARSILVHELVHYVQWHAKGRGAKDCMEWVMREREAFIVQHRWLHGQSKYGKREYPLPRPMQTPVTCNAESVPRNPAG